MLLNNGTGLKGAKKALLAAANNAFFFNLNKPMTNEHYSAETETGRVPSHSQEAEQSVLGSLLLDEDAWDVVAETLQDVDFYRHEHRLIYRAMTEVREEKDQPIDIVTVAESLEEHGEIEKVGGRQYLSFLSNTIPSADNCRAYAEIVRERAQQRRLITVASEIIDRAYEPEGTDALTLVSDAENEIAKIAEGGRKNSGPEHVKAVVNKTKDEIRELLQRPEGLTGLPTGLIEIDNRTSGLQKSDLIIVAARPSMGKTTYAMNLVENALRITQRPCLVFSMEMPSSSIVLRMVSSLGQVNQGSLRSGKLGKDEWSTVGNTLGLISKLPLYIDDTPALTPQEMRARA